MMLSLDSPVSFLKGIGPKKSASLSTIQINTISNLLYYIPRKYLDRNFSNEIFLKEGETVTLLVTVVDSFLAHGKKSRLVVSVKTKRGEQISLVFFKGIQFFKKIIKSNSLLVITGKLEYFRGMQIIHPEFEVLDSEEDDLTHAGRIIPLYPSTETLKEDGLDSKGFRNLLRVILDECSNGNLEIPEVLPEKVLLKRNLMLRKEAFEEIHFPTSMDSLLKAKRRFAYEELYYFSLLMEFKKLKREKVKRILWPLPESITAKKILNSLPFKLTEDQINGLTQLKEQTKRDIPAAFLLQGDVGSGKTITALLFALHYIDNNIQVCLVAPTEILARQHYQTILGLLQNSPFLRIELFLGKDKEKIKKEKLDRLKSGDTLLAIGTHTLFQDDICFKDLGLVIIDEQHKFGVEQRESLRSKGKNPDILAMTATPIPRTLCLTLYGDLKMILIKNKPAGRKPILTKWVTEDKRQNVYSSIKKYISQGRQAFVVYPLIEESEKIDLESCISSYEKLKRDTFSEFSVGLLHGKMKSIEKDQVMDGFKKNEIQILVTTTVVEVGIDVPNATILVVENSDRFGISQLHQLRGRVGRSDLDSFCILMTSSKYSEDAKVRLEAMVSSGDGFYLSEVDLKLRGPGELLGIRQSGLPDFKIANIGEDLVMIEEARQDIQEGITLTDLEKTEITKRFEEGKILFSN
jgi:ATP-dependent DNA helicase RecG